MKRDNIIFDIIEKEHQRQLKGIAVSYTHLTLPTIA